MKYDLSRTIEQCNDNDQLLIHQNDLWVLTGLLDHNLDYDELLRLNKLYSEMKLPLTHFNYPQFFAAPLPIE